MASIQLRKVKKTFKGTVALNGLDMNIDDGQFFCVLGPPGAGKTTLLRLIVGLETPDEGDILIAGERVNDIHPSKRDISMIFQNLALYPDKTVFENIAFPLRQQKKELKPSEDEIQRKVTDIAKQLKIDWLTNKLPSQLSGGERQRVAIGRAIIRKPKAYLMDEPLSNLDALLRLEMRVGLKELQTNLKETFVYVTHDQAEALSLGDKIAVLNNGELQQVDEPEKMYAEPSNMFVAAILGNPPMNFLKCGCGLEKGGIIIKHNTFKLKIESRRYNEIDKSLEGASEIILGMRPENVEIYFNKSRPDMIEAAIYVTEPLGNETIVDVQLGRDIIKIIANADCSATIGQKIWLDVMFDKLHLFHPVTHQCVFHASIEDSFSIF